VTIFDPLKIRSVDKRGGGYYATYRFLKVEKALRPHSPINPDDLKIYR
jgi:hypothetical protein